MVAVQQHSFGQQPLGDVALVPVTRSESNDKLLVIQLRHVFRVCTRRVLVSQSIQSPLQTVDACWITICILIAMIAVIPVENVKTTIGTCLLNHRHKPRIICAQQVCFRCRLVCGFEAFNAVAVDAASVDVAHVEFFAILLGIRIAVVPMNATVRGLLMFMADDAFDLPSERRIRATLAMVVAGFRQMPQVINHTRADEGFSFIVERDAPGIARAFAKHLELASLRVNAKHRTGEVPGLLTLFEVRILRTINNMRRIEDSVEPI